MDKAVTTWVAMVEVRANGGGQQQAQQAANGAEEAVGGFQRGLDSGLAKSAPSAVGLSQKTYRSYRRRLELFGPAILTTWQGDCCGRSIPGDVAVAGCGLGCSGEHRLR